MLLAVALSAAAASIASLALFAVAIGLALVTLSAGAVVLVAATTLTVVRTLSHREAHEGEPIRLIFNVRGLKWLPVLLEGREQSGRWALLSPAGATIELAVPRRGAYRLVPSQLRLRDALGICELTVRAGRPEELLILPVPDVTAGARLRGWAAVDDQEPDGIRPYTSGTPLGRIDWTSLARGLALQARHLSAGRMGAPLVVVDTAGASSSGLLDWIARTAAGCVLTLARDGGCRVLLPGDATATSVSDVERDWGAIHRRLATLSPSGMTAPGPRADDGPTIVVHAGAAPRRLVPARPLPPDVVSAAAVRP